MNINKTCRTCWAEAKDLFYIFEITDGKSASLAERLSTFVETKAERGDGLPECICMPCKNLMDIMETVRTFQMKAQQVDAGMRELLQVFQLSEPACESSKTMLTSFEIEQICLEDLPPLAANCADLDDDCLAGASVATLAADEYERSAAGLLGEESVPADPFSMNDKQQEITPLENTMDTFICKNCPLEFPTVLQLCEHQKISHNCKFVCPLCGKGFGTKSNRNRHIQLIHHINCTDCSDKFNNFENLYEHQRFVHGYIYQCPICPRVYNDDLKLKRHSVYHTRFSLKCDKCSKRFKLIKNLRLHMARHKEYQCRNYQCRICFAKFSERLSLQRHMLDHTVVPTKEPPNSQTIADKGTEEISSLEFKKETEFETQSVENQTQLSENIDSMAELQPPADIPIAIKAEASNDRDILFNTVDEQTFRRIREDTQARNTYVCPYCDKITRNSFSNFKRHLRTMHSMTCVMCNIEFSSPRDLADHNQSHHHYQFKCSSCISVFATAADLKSHGRFHAKNKPIAHKAYGSCRYEKPNTTQKITCALCKKGSTTVYNFKRHLVLVHRDYCSACDLSFAKSDDLIQHYMSTHNTET